MIWEEQYQEKVNEDFILGFLLSILSMNKAANLGLSKMFSKGFAVVSSKEKRGGSDVLLLQFNILLMRYSEDTGLTS